MFLTGFKLVVIAIVLGVCISQSYSQCMACRSTGDACEGETECDEEGQECWACPKATNYECSPNDSPGCCTNYSPKCPDPQAGYCDTVVIFMECKTFAPDPTAHDCKRRKGCIGHPCQ